MFIDDAALKAAEALEAARVLGGEDLLDIRAGQSTLTDQTVAFLTDKRQYSANRLDWIRRVLALHDESVTKGFIERKVFDVPPEVAAELAEKQRLMAEFASEFRPILLGADGAVFAVTDPQPVEVQAKKAKK